METLLTGKKIINTRREKEVNSRVWRNYWDEKIQENEKRVTSAQIKPLSKSEWMAPAAWGAFDCRRICQHLTWKEKISLMDQIPANAPTWLYTIE